jgi:Uma2 family endonuclease
MLGDCLTIDDYERLPDVLAPQHNMFRDLLTALLAPFVRANRLGIVISGQAYDFDGNAYGPDVSFIGESKRPLLGMKLRVQRFVPDLAIEIVSANDPFEKLVKKAQRYRQCGTQEVWIFSVETRQVFLFSENRRTILDENDDFRPEPIPGFSIRIGDLLDRY